ncbi:D-alanyl-D-alanine carboxypeptidase, partial [Candidatus Falkowbacteria bacterium]|nr:D-alanyl-D-alanine carboxypeptidase [Candidatus Falkowbacteria bacterium]
DSEATRAQEAEQIVNWAFRQFVVKTLAKAGTKLAEAPVWLGAAPSVGLVPATDLQLLLPALAHDGVTAEAVFSGPVTAPIAAGQELGQLVVTVPGMAEHRVPLVAEAAVAEAGFADRVKTAGQRLIARALVAAER